MTFIDVLQHTVEFCQLQLDRNSLEPIAKRLITDIDGLMNAELNGKVNPEQEYLFRLMILSYILDQTIDRAVKYVGWFKPGGEI